MSFSLNVKLGKAQPVEVKVHEQDTVYTVKQHVCRRHQLQPNDVCIIFQGRRLSDSFIIQDSDLAENSVLHAVVVPQNHPADNVGLNIATTLLEADSQTSTEEAGPSTIPPGATGHPYRAHQSESTLLEAPVSLQPSTVSLYYVYCKDVCHRVCPARIRVQCSQCKHGAIQLAKEPCCWRDVLTPNIMTGRCHTQCCPGKTAEFYFKCSGHRRVSETTDPPLEPELVPTSESSLVLQQITANLHDTPCITCTSVSTPILVFTCVSKHVMCLDCFTQYCMTQLDERRFTYDPHIGYTLGCPAGCPDSLITDGHHYRLLGDTQYERYQRFGTEECIIREGGVICPAPRCGEGMFPDNGRRVQCTQAQCLFVFCRDCRSAYHEDDDCETRTTNNTMSTLRVVCDPHEVESRQTIGAISKACPQCKVPVERDGGCLHMTCSRCGCHWCWLCHVTWTRDCQANHWFE